MSATGADGAPVDATLDSERRRLRLEIEAAQHRRDIALAARDAAQGDGVESLVAMARASAAELARMEEHHRDLVSATRQAAEVEAARILDAARAELARLNGPATGGLLP